MLLDPLLSAGTTREAFAHIARQRCRCGSAFLVADERIEPDPATTRPTLTLRARCLNRDCGHAEEFRFLAAALWGQGIGRLATESVDPTNAATLFPAISPRHAAALRLLTVHVGVAGLGTRPADREDLVYDALRPVRPDAAAVAAVAASLAAAARAVEAVAATLASAGLTELDEPSAAKSQLGLSTVGSGC